MGRIARGWALTKASFEVLKLDKEILILPALSFACMVAFLAIWFGLGAVTVGLPADDGTGQPMLFVFAFLLYVSFAFVGTFFGAATIEMATIRLNGGDPVVKDGLRKAWSKKGKLLQWALVAATVGLLLRALRERADSFAGQMFGRLLEAGWAIATYFVVPVLVYQEVGPLQAIKESTGVVKRTWGEAATGAVSTGVIFFLLGLVGLVPLLLGFASGSAFGLVAGVLIAVVYWALLGATSTAISGILTAALYRYAKTGELPAGFQPAVAQAGPGTI